MPGSVAVAAPAETMPFGLAASYRRAREFAMVGNEYRDGRSQRTVLVTLSRRRWTVGVRLDPTALGALRTFYEARNGAQEPFFFYDIWETSPLFSYDETGVDTTGRWAVRFAGPWSQSVGIARADVGLDLVEVG